MRVGALLCSFVFCLLVLAGCPANKREAGWNPPTSTREPAFRAPSTPSEPALIVAARKSELSTLKELIQEGADVNTPGQRGDTALRVLLRNPHCTGEVVQILLNAGARVDTRDLNVAACSDNPEATSIIRLLVESLAKEGGNLNASFTDLENGPFAAILKSTAFSTEEFFLGPAVTRSNPYPLLHLPGSPKVLDSGVEAVERLRFLLSLVDDQRVRESCAAGVLKLAARNGYLGVLEAILPEYPSLAPQCMESARMSSDVHSLLAVRYLLPLTMSPSMAYLIVPPAETQPLKIETVEGPVAEHRGTLYELRPGTYRMRAHYYQLLPTGFGPEEQTGQPNTAVFEAKPGHVYVARGLCNDKEETWRLAAWVVYAPGEHLAFPDPFYSRAKVGAGAQDRYELGGLEMSVPTVSQNPRDPAMTLTMESIDSSFNSRTYVELDELEVSCIGAGLVTVSRHEVAVYSGGILVSIHAGPAAGYRFEGWTGDAADGGDLGCPNAAATTVRLNHHHTLEAHFVRDVDY
jgi:hypothetical protein